MKRILVYNVAATSSGALSVLQNFINSLTDNQEYFWYIIVSTKNICTINKNVKIIRMPLLKNILFRVFFKKIIIKNLVERYSINHILNLQNIPLSIKTEETVFIQNVLPFTSYNFNFFKDSKLWLYKHLYGYLLKRKIFNKNIIVQTNWLKQKLKNFKCNRVEVVTSSPNIYYFKCPKKIGLFRKTFFYPATYESYKNHCVIVKAVDYLFKLNNHIDFKIVFTISNRKMKKILRGKDYLKEYFIASNVLSKEQMVEYYDNSILLFPSKIESCGLPLLEAMVRRSPIICSKNDVLKEITKNYNNVLYFDEDDYITLSNFLQKEYYFSDEISDEKKEMSTIFSAFISIIGDDEYAN